MTAFALQRRSRWGDAFSPSSSSFVFALVCAVALLLPHAGQAQDAMSPPSSRSGVALSVQASTLGPSVGLHFGLSETVRLRAHGAYLPYSFARDINQDDVDARVDGDVALGGPEVRLDWHPAGSSFHLSGGALYNITEADALIFPTSDYQFSDTKSFSPEEIGEMNATMSYPSISPYAGLGFGDALSGSWSFMVELGAYYVGSPEFTFKGEGLIEPTERNEAVLEQGFESFQFFPRFAFGLSYQF